MQRPGKTANEFAGVISGRLGGELVRVFPDPAYGWHPTVFAAPSNAHELQQRAEQIASELRAMFDLKT